LKLYTEQYFRMRFCRAAKFGKKSWKLAAQIRDLSTSKTTLFTDCKTDSASNVNDNQTFHKDLCNGCRDKKNFVQLLLIKWNDDDVAANIPIPDPIIAMFVLSRLRVLQCFLPLPLNLPLSPHPHPRLGFSLLRRFLRSTPDSNHGLASWRKLMKRKKVTESHRVAVCDINFFTSLTMMFHTSTGTTSTSHTDSSEYK